MVLYIEGCRNRRLRMIELPHKSTFHLGVPRTLYSLLNIQSCAGSIQRLAEYFRSIREALPNRIINVFGPSAFYLRGVAEDGTYDHSWCIHPYLWLS